jgi:SRSO17 transposase
VIDESGLAKKGKKSVGVARQWNGRLGKVENSQVGVFGVLSSGERGAFVEGRLYLPDEWTADVQRCDEAGVPAECREYRTKVGMAVEIVRHQRELGVEFAWVGADGLYGQSGWFCRTLEDSGETFMVDVHCDQRVYLAEPEVRREMGKRGGERLATTGSAVRVDELTKDLVGSDWKSVVIRESSGGSLAVTVWHQRVWVWDGEEERARSRHLLVRRDEGEKLKYSLSNASGETPLKQLALMQAQRYWIERGFQDGKSEVGMGEYQMRTWRGWHHHMALVMIAMLFMMHHRMLYAETHPLLSSHDIKVLLAHFLPRRDVGVEEIIRQMEVRHRKRARAILWAKKKRTRHAKEAVT